MKKSYKTAHLVAALAIAGMAFGVPSGAQAQAASGAAEFLGSFAGDWRGSGEARLDLKDEEPTRVSCRISTEFEAGSIRLQNSGRCGSTKGSRNVSGYIQERDGRLIGNFLGALKPEEVLRQNIRIVGNQLVAETSIQDRNRMVRVRTILTEPRNDSFGVRTEVFDFDARVWEKAAELRFDRQ